MLVHERLRHIERRAFAHRHQTLLRRHDSTDRFIQAILEPEIPIGNDTDDLAALHHRQPRNTVLSLQRDGITHGHVGGDRDRIRDNTEFVALDARDLTCLFIGGEVLVDDADPAFLGHGNGKAGLGHGIHGGGNQRNIQGDIAGQASDK